MKSRESRGKQEENEDKDSEPKRERTRMTFRLPIAGQIADALPRGSRLCATASVKILYQKTSMDDFLEEPSAIPAPSLPSENAHDEEEQSSGDEDGGPDWTKLPYATISAVARFADSNEEKDRH